MALDAVCLRAAVDEARTQVLGVRVDKIQQPARDQVILLLRGNLRLLADAGPGAARLQITETLRDNPAEPPMFCMLLRKHLVGGHISALRQEGLERVAEAEVDVTDEFGRPGKRYLVLEAIGRRSNLILLDGERRIIDCLRRVDAEMSPERQILPGLFYTLPTRSGKRSLLEASREDFDAGLLCANPERTADAFLLDQYFGLSPLLAREAAFAAGGETDCRLQTLDAAGRERLWQAVDALGERVRTQRCEPILLKREGAAPELTYCPIQQYGAAAQAVPYARFSTLLDDFFAAREQQDRLRQRGQDLVKAAATARDRLRRKLAQQELDYAETQNRDRLRLFGELITANLHRMERGAAALRAENYYDPDLAVVDIPLDPLATPQQNAARYFKRYAKAKTAERYLREQMAIARADAVYLESVLEELSRAETEQDFLEIRDELRQSGFLRNRGKEKKELKRASRPREFLTDGGVRVLVGRDNRQNDRLTRDADRRDLWLHTQKIHGSHVILCTGGAEPAETDLRQAAMLAAWFSQGRDSGTVNVDYTQVKNVKKPAGARPGMVTYTAYRTVAVTPEAGLAEKLAGRKSTGS